MAKRKTTKRNGELEGAGEFLGADTEKEAIEKIAAAKAAAETEAVRRFTVSDICSAFGVRLADIKHVRRRASRAPKSTGQTSPHPRPKAAPASPKDRNETSRGARPGRQPRRGRRP